ncbi:MAG: flagellar biosynthetic protein FliR [Gemmataceae bacterium]|nr:flagellar biosynthetic protein FliR [Gemmataceae bacterium]
MEQPVLLFSLVVARVGAFVAVMPLFSGQGTPRVVRVGLALSLSVFFFAHLGVPADVARIQASGQMSWLLLGLSLGREAVLGAVVALLFSLFLAPLRIAGEFVTQQIGLAPAGLLGASFSSPASPLTVILESLGGLVFLELDGHHIVLAVLHASFAKYPLGGLALPTGTAAVGGVAAAEAMGVMLAGPLALALFLLTVSLALMGRAVPQLNIYSVGFALQSLVCLVAALLLLPDLIKLIAAALARMGQLIQNAL